MSQGVYGCACCSGALGAMFAANKNVARLRETEFRPCSDPVASSPARSLFGSSRRAFLSGTAALAGVAAIAPSLARAQKIETIIFRGGPILTVDSAFSQVEAMAVRGDRILAVGAEADVRAVAGTGTTIVELDGKVMLPGFVDPHAHVVAGSVVAKIMEYVGVARFTTAAEVLEHLSNMAEKIAPGEWVVARNYDPAIQTGRPGLTRDDLDAASIDHPIFVLNASGHLAYANSRAFEIAGIGEQVENPPGAEFVRDEDGRLTGEMKNNLAFMKVLSAYPGLVEVDPVEALIELLASWSRLGLTTVSELALGALSQSPADAQILIAAAESGRLAARIRAYPFYSIGAEAWDASGVVPGDDALVRISGYKLVADGSNQGFTGLQRKPYLNSDSRGLAYMSQEELAEVALDRASLGWPLAIHANGDAGIDNVLDACDAMRMAGIDLDPLRIRIEHCSILHDDQIERMKGLGVSASFLIGHVYYWGVAMRDDVFGLEKAKLLCRARSVEAAGVGFTLHSDFMVTDPNPLHMIQMAVTRSTWKEPDYVLAPEERVSVETAIRGVTSEAAWQLHSDQEIGSLEAGKFADFVILGADPRNVHPDRIKDIAVVETWVNGKQRYQA